MIDIQAVRVVLTTRLDKLVKFDWKKLIPKFTYEKYPYGSAGIELTWPWKKEEKGFGTGLGLGVGVGLGVFDIWMGWPRNRESLHTADCRH